MDAALRQIGFASDQPRQRSTTKFARHVAHLMILSLVGGPVLAGLAFTILPAFGYLPSIGWDEPGLEPWRTLLTTPGWVSSLRLSLSTGLVATSLALVLAFGLCAALHGRRHSRAATGLALPLLAAPHGAMAIGLAFLLAPSGWLIRLASPWLTGFHSPPDVATVQDPCGGALVLGLVVKELPFFLVMVIAALNQLPVDQLVRSGRSLGYGRGMIWAKIIAPQVYTQIRLPIYAVLAFAVSVVDMALILAPSNPPTLAVATVRLLTSPDLSRYPPGAAAATLQLLLVAVSIGAWRIGERIAVRVGRGWITSGTRGSTRAPILHISALVAASMIMLGLGSLLALAIWSVAWRWPFPDALPVTWSLEVWRRQLHAVIWPALNTLTLGASTSAVALILAVVWLELDDRVGTKRRAPWANPLYLSLVVPQIAFLFGVQILVVISSADGTFIAVAWSHLIFVFPYLLLSLEDPWKSLDPRYARSAASLGVSPLRILFVIKLPLLLRPILVAAAVGFAVSAAQYLSTLFVGGGRLATLSTESIAMASGGDRRVVGVLTVLQALLPFIVYLAALVTPNPMTAGRHSHLAQRP